MDSFLGHFLLAFSNLLSIVIQIFIFIIIIRSILSWVGPLPNNQFMYILRKITDPVFRFVHRVVPFSIIGGIDVSPIIILFTLYFIDTLFSGMLRDFAADLLQKRSYLP